MVAAVVAGVAAILETDTPETPAATKLLFRSVVNEAAPAEVARLFSEAVTEVYAAAETTFTL